MDEITSFTPAQVKKAVDVASKTGGVVKVSMNLPVATVEDLRSMAERRHTTLTEVIRDALGILKFLDNATQEGKTILLKAPDGSTERLLY